MISKAPHLALEAFADMPEYHLTVCAPIDREQDFSCAYHRELFQTPTIQTVGWVDISSGKFEEKVCPVT